MKVLLAASEVAPIIKLGGLGDVVGSLPKALEKLGADVDVIVPFFPSAKIENLKVYKSLEMRVPYAMEEHLVEVFKTKLPNSDVDVVMLKNSRFFGIGGGSAFLDSVNESEMFAFFDRAVVEFIEAGFNTYDLVHCNDWHTGLVTHLMEDELAQSRPATLLTIHNLSYQGTGPENLTRELGIVPGEHSLIDWDLDDARLNFLLQGITSSDYISTVSPSYASEILFKDVGGSLSEILQSRRDRLVGILNGIDYSVFKRNYDVSNWRAAKQSAKRELQRKLGLDVADTAPIFSFISRLDSNQKGLDILFESISGITDDGGQFVLLGTGDRAWEEKFKGLAAADGKVSVNIKFDVELANMVYEGSDFILVPSKYEPCGLTQMIGMHYGTVPIVHAVGGLKDTVVEGQTGFVFHVYSNVEFRKAIKKAFGAYRDEERYPKMVENAMNMDFSWNKSAAEYMKLYEKVIQIRRGG
ncbi:glycogen synthase [candidate division WWE3 bacterium]|nr:glycogen synthase [candidate division WWE3 bacterium]